MKPRIISTVILMLALSTASGLAPKPRPLVDICKEKFETSSAHQSCPNAQYEDVGDGYCKITAWCRSVNHTLSTTVKRTKAEEAGSLYNCKGVLTVRVC